jgi:hypothetical protein
VVSREGVGPLTFGSLSWIDEVVEDSSAPHKEHAPGWNEHLAVGPIGKGGC